MANTMKGSISHSTFTSDKHTQDTGTRKYARHASFWYKSTDTSFLYRFLEHVSRI